ncbi:MAG TPA: hypothetical protein VH134_09985 [Candidatus Dormibacteraeota bacterium]|jgi:hypothetical protein|nr:hypothetical protein [Candidatus Dormibacteraeota bacterium]
MTMNVQRDEKPTGAPAKDFEETGDQARERKQRWGDHEPGGATMTPGGNPETKREEEDERQ